MADRHYLERYVEDMAIFDLAPGFRANPWKWWWFELMDEDYVESTLETNWALLGSTLGENHLKGYDILCN